MEAMHRIMAFGSHFELVSADRLKDVRVVQIWPEAIYLDAAGDEAFLCEVMNEEREK